MFTVIVCNDVELVISIIVMEVLGLRFKIVVCVTDQNGIFQYS